MKTAPAVLSVGPGAALQGECRVPGDKSITHRALILAALAGGESRLGGALDALDTHATAQALRALGTEIEWPARGPVRVRGTAGRWRPEPTPLDLGNSGTGLRLLAGALVGRGIRATLSGDASLRSRPMERIAAPLRSMGAEIRTAAGRPPLAIGPGRPLRGIEHRLEVPSAQVKSALLLAGLVADGACRIVDPYGTRDHTERLLPAFGVDVDRDGEAVVLRPGPLHGAEVEIPGDFSAAAFLVAAALAVPGSDLSLPAIGINPTRTGLLAVLRRMGAQIEIQNERSLGGEPAADLRVRAGRLRGTTVPAGEIPRLIDELPVLMVLAAGATGVTVIEGAGELRYKETDRIEAMRAGLTSLGTRIEVDGDRITLGGRGFSRGARIASTGDHRVAMAFAVAGLMAPAAVTVEGAEWVATSFPDFPHLLAGAGARVTTGR